MNVAFPDIGKHLKLLVGIADGYACGDGGGDALHAAGIGNDNAFYIFDNVAADDDVDLLRYRIEYGTGLRRGIRHCDRLCTAHCRDKLLLKYLQILRILHIILYHFKYLL